MTDLGQFGVHLLASFMGTSGAMYVALRWLRADVNRAHERLNEHTQRIRALELRRKA